MLTRFESHVSEVVFKEQRIWSFFGNRLVEEYIRRNAQAAETELSEVDTSFAALL
jgi:hypothetical protein